MASCLIMQCLLTILSRNNTCLEVAQERAPTHGEDEYEYENENDQPDNADENVSVSGSDRSVSEMIFLSEKPAKKNTLSPEGMFQVH